MQAGADKDLAKLSQIQLAGEQFTLSSLKAVFSDASTAMDDSDSAKAAAKQAVQTERTKRARAAQVLSALRSFLLGYFGAQAVNLLLDFGITPPKSKATKTVATKAVAVAKAKATRAARGTKGSVAKKAVVGTVNAQAIKEAIDSPTTSPVASTGAAATPPAAAPPAPAAAPAVPVKS